MKYARARRQFEAETTDHEMTILHDEDVYRHLRFRRPGTAMWGFDLITWPGHLAISGDVGDGWSFCRLHDMTEFFTPISEPWLINPQYWAEKMPHHHIRAAQHYSEDLLHKAAIDSIGEWSMNESDTSAAIAQFRDAWENEIAPDENEQRRFVMEFEFTDSDGSRHDLADSWEWDVNDWDHHFLLACFAIQWGLAKYRNRNANQEKNQ